ncbi:hypothetical protein [Tunturiibacter lichenicola]|uniref:hypothetical protein n=1 Tax=Tunturiibacter lichenicola TaxID=2051959 RepID=UPI0021B4A4D7|nr:hypothetical protein [Edaphobacter lichenicola]
MPLQSFVDKVKVTPSLTTWTRLEPQPRDASMERSLQAQVRDPLWLLARQWQVGEFLGDDAGSPIHATIAAEMRTITTYRPGLNPASTVPIDPTLPIEVHVERELVTLEMRGSAQQGLYFENLIRQSSVATPEAVIAAFRTSFPIAPTSPDPTYAPPDALRFRSIAAGRVTDGEALYASARAVAAGQTPTIPLPPEATNPGVPAVISSFLAFRGSLFSEPTTNNPWQSQNLDYEFALGSPGTDETITLEAPEFPGGHLDWYSFSLDQTVPTGTQAPTGAQAPPATQTPPAQVSTTTFDFLPNQVVFRGMPDSRWWNFEDAVTDFGQLDVEHVDLAKLLVMEFALVYGNDWFWVPIPIQVGISGSDPTPRGTLSRITNLVITDTFGVRTLIRPSEQTQVNANESPWSMFKVSGEDIRSDFIMMAPTLGVTDDADPLEEVLFLRDDMAAMAWAIEHRIPSELDSATDAYALYQQRLKDNPPPAPLPIVAGGPAITYTLETPPPDNWIPMVPVLSPANELYLRRGTMEIPTQDGFIKLQARGAILEPQHPFFVTDRAVPRSGTQVDRYFRYTRSSDGTIFVWLARRSGQGRGSGWSGLRFDLVQKLGAS